MQRSYERKPPTKPNLDGGSSKSGKNAVGRATRPCLAPQNYWTILPGRGGPWLRTIRLHSIFRIPANWPEISDVVSHEIEASPFPEKNGVAGKAASDCNVTRTPSWVLFVMALLPKERPLFRSAPIPRPNLPLTSGFRFSVIEPHT